MVEIAKILKPQGLKGEMKLDLFLKDEETWKKIKNVQIEHQNYIVKSIRFYKGFGYILLCEIDSIEKCEIFRNKHIFVDKSELETDQNEYLIDDLVGCKVVDENENYFGEVESIESYGGADIINILNCGAKRSFPFLKTILVDVDVKAKKIVVNKEKLKEVMI